MDNYKPSDAELEILQIIWELEPVSVKDIHEVISKSKSVGYTTTLKQIQRMLEKDLLKREKVGKSHLYASKINKEDTQHHLFDRLLNSVFKGSAMNLAMHALGKTKANADEIEMLRKMLDKMEGGNDE